MQHNRFRICPMQRYLCFRIILLQVQIHQANNVRHLFSPLLRSRASTRNSRSGLFFFYGLVLAFIAGIYFVNTSRAVPGADTRSGFLLLPESGRSRLSPASFPGFVCGQCPEPIRAPDYSSYLRRSAYRLRRPKHRSAAPDRSVKISHGRLRAVSPVGGVTPGSSDSPGVSSR